MTGSVTGEREAIVPLRVRNLGGRPEIAQAIVDTGFTEFLAISYSTIARLGLPYRGELPLTLADGSEADLSIYRAIVEWHGHARPVSVVAIQKGALLGMAILEGSIVTLTVRPRPHRSHSLGSMAVRSAPGGRFVIRHLSLPQR